jgi:hypothetical protein
MEGKKRIFEKYDDFLNNRRKNKPLEQFRNIYPLNPNNLISSNTTSSPFNLNMIDMYKDNNISDSGCLSSLRGQFNSKYKKNQKNNSNNKNKSDLETNYKTFYTSDSPKKDKIPINIKKRKDYIINDYKNKGNRALSTSNIIKYNNNINNERNNINNYNKNKKKINIIKHHNTASTKRNFSSNFSFDSPSLNKELNRILSTYDFKDINDYNDINIDDKSIKIHFRNLLYLVKELEAKNELLKKEIRNKNNLIYSLENQIKNSNKNKDKNNIKNFMIKKYNNNILLDNSKLKSEIVNLENKLKQQKIHYEDIINDYTNQLSEEKNKNNIMDNNFKNIENKFKNSNNKIIDIKDELKDVTFMKAKLEDMNEKYEVINLGQQKRIEELENQLKVVLTLVKNLFNKENNVLYPMRTKLFYEISNLGKNC